MASRKDLKEISLNSYITALRSLFKRLNPGDDLKQQLDTTFLKNKKKIMSDIDDKPINSKKNILTSILVALSSEPNKDEKLLDSYQITLKELSTEYGKFLEKQEKTPTQEANWITYDKFIEVINELLDEVKKQGLVKKDKLTRAQYTLLQKYVVLSLYQTYSFRNDFAMMKVVSPKEYNDLELDIKNDNNYMIRDLTGTNNKFTIKLNAFKNVKRIGSKSYDVPEKLAKILKLFFKFNKSGFVLTLNNARDGLSANGITKLLNSIFSKYANGRKISSSLLRHISISEKLKDEPTLLEKKAEDKKTEDLFQHSSKMNDLYRKV
jgi:site-specific recombinase XerD